MFLRPRGCAAKGPRIAPRGNDSYVNGMTTVGLVQLPGMMTGQIFAGSSSLLAIRYQMVVVLMQGAATALGSLIFVRLAAGRHLTPAHQLRRYLL